MSDDADKVRKEPGAGWGGARVMNDETPVIVPNPCCGHTGYFVIHTQIDVQPLPTPEGLVWGRALLTHTLECPNCHERGIVTAIGTLDLGRGLEADQRFAVHDAKQVLSQ